MYFQLSMSVAFEPATVPMEGKSPAGRAAAKFADKRPASKPGATSEITNKGPTPKPADESVPKAPVEAAEPRAGTDKNTTHEELRTIVAVGCTGVWVIPVVPVRAHRWRDIGITWANENADRNMCRITRGWNHQKA
jgi:hypothetical protein